MATLRSMRTLGAALVLAVVLSTCAPALGRKAPGRSDPKGSKVVYSPYVLYSDLEVNATRTGRARVLDLFPFMTEPEVGARAINPQLNENDFMGVVPYGDECEGRAASQGCWETLALWSGATVKRDPTGAVRLVGLTDRGINPDCPARDGLPTTGFAVPGMAPAIFDVTFDINTHKAAMRRMCPLKDMQGRLISGLPNSIMNLNLAADGSCVAPAASLVFQEAGYPTGFDPRALDPEAIAKVPGTNYCLMAEEYGPSVAVIHCDLDEPECGTVLHRYVPRGSDVKTLVPPAAYGVSDILPPALANRRPNRGFEAIAISPSGRTAFVFMQSPLGLFAYNLTALGMGPNHPNAAASRSSHTILAIRLDLSDGPFKARTTGMFAYVADRADATNQSAWVATSRPQDIRVSEAAWVADMAGAHAEAPILLVNERALFQAKGYLADFSSATDLLPMYSAPGANQLALDAIWTQGYDAGLAQMAAMGVRPARKALVVDTGHVDPARTIIDEWTGTEKIEAMLPVNKCVLAMGEDNDFGIGNIGPATMHFVQLPRCLDTVYAQMEAAAA